MNYLTYVENVEFMKKKKHGKVKGPKKSEFIVEKELNCQWLIFMDYQIIN